MGKFYSLLTSVGIYEQNLSLPSYEMDLKLMENALIEGLRLSKDTIRTRHFRLWENIPEGFRSEAASARRMRQNIWRLAPAT